MEEVKTKAGISQALENVGIFVDTHDAIDIDLMSLIEDSIQFISLVVQLEEIFDIEIPNEDKVRIMV